jgi:predicted anti-sigma-YlaC factor YlaD
MNRIDCESTRDLLPPLVRAELTGPDAATVEAHLATCAACLEEVAVVRQVHALKVVVPAGLEARVLTAVRRRMPAPRWVPARWAMAATFAAAVLGGTVIFERLGVRLGDDVQPAFVELDDGVVTVLSWAAAEDPLLHGLSALDQLSIEELEVLLAELES